MITKYDISPWSDTLQEHINIKQKPIKIPRTEPLKSKQNKFLKLSQRCLTENQFIVVHKKKKKKLSKFKFLSKSLSKSTDNQDFIEKTQLSPLKIKEKMSKKMSTQLFLASTKIQVNLSSQRKKFLVSQSTHIHDKISQQKKQLFQSNIQQKNQSMPYFFSLLQKQNVKYNKQKNTGDEKNDRLNDREIFKKVEQISIKRKKLIKLPKISVACSERYM